MVLAELGKRINTALKTLTTATVIDEEALEAILKEICGALLESDVNVRLVQSLRKNIKSIVNLQELSSGINKKRIIQKAIFDELCKLVDPGQGVVAFKPRKGKPNVIMFVGLQGSGKTTTCTKMAYYYQRKGYRTCLVCTDTFRAGAFDQLKQNATKAKIPYYGSYTESDPVQLAMEGVDKFKVEGFEVIIVDTSGRHRQETELFQEMQQISNVIKPDNVVFVLDGTIGQAADAHARAFQETVDIGSIVITKMDGHAKGGGAISAVAATGSPILFIGTGEHIHDLEIFKSQSFVRKMLGMGDIDGLMETVQDMKLENTDLMKNIEQGKFTLRSMKQQFELVTSMGPISKLASMIPGMPQEMLAQMDGQDGPGLIKRFMCIFDSMTETELDSDGKVFNVHPTRIYRVAKGSGVTVQEIETLLVQFKQMAGMIKSIGGSKSMLNKMAAGNQRGGVHPNQMAKMQSQFSKMMPPGMMQQMMGRGGAGGMPDMSALAEMMGGMGGEGGMPDMSALANMMGGMGGMGGLQNLMGGLGGGASGAPSMGRGKNIRTVRRK
ncbi:Signal recognition particle [Batrachochytrium dendrobatidis]|nr:Signal recognition particle [Batrachochytrium dendrobatidis]KAK5673447.1 Signal recognition particle [Batrachochytrium dendrobatidis]